LRGLLAYGDAKPVALSTHLASGGRTYDV